jgi:hypothetical protein
MKETLEEAAERIAYDSTEANKGFPSMKMFIEGAKWQSEKMYSEQEVKEIIESYRNNRPKVYLTLFYKKWFEQFKKK